jgi:chemotaxis receptor (MCP) glutamine deamidase CheD
MSRPSYIAPPPPAPDVAFGESILWAGDLVVERSPVRMSTVLGSCVSVCLYDPQLHFGGMNHFLVPNGGNELIHGEWATTELINRMQRLGSRTQSMHGKVFGGGSPLKLIRESHAVGDENVKSARRVLAAFGIPVVAERVGHGAGIRLFFENWTGVVWLRPHQPKETP